MAQQPAAKPQTTEAKPNKGGQGQAQGGENGKAKGKGQKNGKGNGQGQANKNLKTLNIKTSAQCGMCQSTLEQGLMGVTGVHEAKLNLPSRQLRLRYDPNVIDPKTLELAVQSLGYDANDKAANPAAYEALPACCKKGGGH
jgi:copper chaperone CopZ